MEDRSSECAYYFPHSLFQMGKLKQKRHIFTIKKHFQYKSRQSRALRKAKGINQFSSTPIDNRKRSISCLRLTPFRSPFHKKQKRSPAFRSYCVSSPSKKHSKVQLNFSTSDLDSNNEETLLYSDDDHTPTIIQSTHNSTLDDMHADQLDEEVDALHATFRAALDVLKEHNLDSDITTFLQLVSENKFPLDNVSFHFFRRFLCAF